MYTIIDGSGLLAAVAMAALLLLASGYAIGAATGALGFRDADRSLRIGIAALLALTLLPAPLALAATLSGLASAAILMGVVVVCGAWFHWRDGMPRPTPRAVGLAVAILTFVAYAWIDVEIGDRLHQSLIVTDMIKHAAITRGIVDSGATPPPDPFFARSEPAVFYYFYFMVPALIETITRGFIHSRAAVGGVVVWTGVAFAALVVVLYRRAGLRPSKHSVSVLALLAMCGGVQVLLAAPFATTQIGLTNVQITPWPIALLWVPHHFAALMSSWVALLLVTEAAEARSQGVRAALIILAGAGLASAAGQSVWVTLGTILTVGIWTIVQIVRRRFAPIAVTALAGCASLVLALPYLVQVIGAGAQQERAALAFAVRPFSLSQAVADGIAASGGWTLVSLLNLLALPLNYAYELGILLAGALLYWTHRAVRRGPRNDISDLLLIAAGVAFVLGSFVKSAIANNDLGWRIMMFAQLSMLLWTAHVLVTLIDRMPTGGPIAVLARVPRPLAALLVLGLASVAYDVVMMRFARQADVYPFAAFKDVERDLRQSFTWIRDNVARDVVVQHDPNRHRAYAFALYGRNPVAVADPHNGYILGVSKAAARKRLDDIAPIFASPLSADAVARIAQRNGIGILVIATGDPVWTARPDWLDGPAVVHRSPHVRVISVERLEQKGSSS